jgi:hypothetical protein
MHRDNLAKYHLLSVLVLMIGCAHQAPPERGSEPVVAAPVAAPQASVNALAVRSEQIRTDCVAGRRLICGKILKVETDGVVVESGYTDLLRPPLTESWLIPATVMAHRNPAALELNQPGTPCLGVVYLTDLPRRPKPKVSEYVVITGYPAGTYVYTAAPGVAKPIRKFAAGLDTAVRLVVQGEGSGAKP